MLGTAYGEKIEVYACAGHTLSGRSRLVLEEKGESSTQSFGWSKGSDRCRASATTGIATPPEKLDDSDVVIADAEDCPKGATKVHVFGELSRRHPARFAKRARRSASRSGRTSRSI